MSTPEGPAGAAATEPAQGPPLAPPGERGPLRWLRAAERAFAPVSHAPVTVFLVVALWAVGLFTGSLGGGPADRLLSDVGVGVPALAEGRWWTPLTSILWCSGIGNYVGSTLLLLLIGPAAEIRMGSVRTAVLLVVGQVLGALLGTGAVKVSELAGDDWPTALAQELTATPGIAACAVGAFLSFRLSALWRRRLQLALIVFPLTLALYVGHLQDVLRFAGTVVGLALGALAHRDARRLRVPHASHTEGRVLVALTVAASALGPLIATLYRDALGPFDVLDLYVSGGPDPQEIADACAGPGPDCARVRAQDRFYGSPAMLMGVAIPLLLLVLAEGLRRGLRPAWRIAVAAHLVWLVLMAYLLSDITAHPGHYVLEGSEAADRKAAMVQAVVEQALLPLFVLVLLLGTRRRFDQRLGRAAVTTLTGVIGGTLLLCCAAYVGIGYAVRDQFAPDATFGRLVAGLPAQFLPPSYEPLFFRGSSPVPVGGTALSLYEYCGVVFWVVALVALLVAFRRPSVRHDAGAAARARALLTTQGGGTLSYLAMWDGNDYWFTADGRAAVAYRVRSTVALTTGDPFGVPSARGDAVEGFAAFCDEHGLTPCFYSVTAATKARTDAFGWSAVQVAEDTVVPLPDLAFTGKKWQDVRTALNKAKKQGITAEWHVFPEAPLDLTDQIRSISEEWVADKGLPEMGFTLGGLAELDDPHVRCLLAVDERRTVHGVTSWMPVHGANGAYDSGQPVGWTLDFMRRRSDGFRGVMEFLIASAALGFQEEGAQFLSLSGAPLARADAAEPTAALQRLLDCAGRALEPVYGFRSLLHFKAKFQPEYHPMYMCYPDPAALPSITRAIGKAYLPHLSAAQGVRLMRKLTA
ncbi:Phosphatidylglycerol lysyltransferase [Streptomyces sp. YIM 121038]|uniref:phosphatidylglycerol lysyltransferase domain-containing protein n=1 Tax=Streptomyces sp. YIM 121038 TaxID=2136401 RepID=UPI001110AD27|nr:phosphatidylglycerol lysyltransferase domain-containing protein [Streptomyces sp. YIM 121038]QCX79036.1 Phosphatidylglycerol lysyltransferase [Streptomyces sp. YIM 121038]